MDRWNKIKALEIGKPCPKCLWMNAHYIFSLYNVLQLLVNIVVFSLLLSLMYWFFQLVYISPMELVVSSHLFMVYKLYKQTIKSIEKLFQTQDDTLLDFIQYWQNSSLSIYNVMRWWGNIYHLKFSKAHVWQRLLICFSEV